MHTEGIILAAGLSSRAGVYKMELKFGEKTLIEKAAESMYDTCSRIIVVSGHNAEKINCIFKNDKKIMVVYNRHYMDGMFSSVKEGIKHITTNRFFILPGDYPKISKHTYEKMLTATGGIIIPKYMNKKGHPILISRCYINDLLNNTRYSSLRDFVNLHEISMIDVDDAGILYDIDTLDDYAIL